MKKLLKAMAPLLLAGIVLAQKPATSLAFIHKLYIEPMPNDLDKYIRAEIFKQMPARLTVVTNKADAEAVMGGVSREHDSTASRITGRYLGLHDTATGEISIVAGGAILWASEAGDRNMWVGALARGGERKVAGRLVHNLKKAMKE